jgi:hypothetical protein
MVKMSTLIDGFLKLQKGDLEKIKSALYLIYYARKISEKNKTLSFLTYINGIEGLINHRFIDKKEKCKDCGQDKFAVSEKFHKFIKENYDEYKGTGEATNRDKRISDIYSLRSKIVHQGLSNLFIENFWKTETEIKANLINEDLYRSIESISLSVAKKYIYTILHI